jgi:hypothetical protein
VKKQLRYEGYKLVTVLDQQQIRIPATCVLPSLVEIDGPIISLVAATHPVTETSLDRCRRP